MLLNQLSLNNSLDTTNMQCRYPQVLSIGVKLQISKATKTSKERQNLQKRHIIQSRVLDRDQVLDTLPKEM